ncbi:MAG: J domain-containing protein, partial [Desulfobacterales bacterium]
MYLAQTNLNGRIQYAIRESYRDGDYFLSRDLFDLGTDPAQYIIYPGGNAFYIDPVVEDHLDELGVTVQENNLEDIFWRFLDPDIQHALQHFRHREALWRQSRKSAERPAKAESPVHIFDRRRLHYLKFGRMEQGYLWLVPQKLFNVLRDKSRDEIEQLF